jgi:hypothetical protein
MPPQFAHPAAFGDLLAALLAAAAIVPVARNARNAPALLVTHCLAFMVLRQPRSRVGAVA